MLFLLITPFIVSFLISLLVTPIVIIFANKFKLIDDPKTHKHPAIIHKNPVPRAGGLGVFLAIALGVIFFLKLDRTFVSILLGGSLVVLVGLLDDKYDLSPYIRFASNIIAAAIVVFGGVTIPFITNPLGGIMHFTSINIPFGITLSISNILAIIWIVWIMNMLNWSKGVDGQMPGIAAISAAVIGIASLRFATLTSTNIMASQLSFIVAGASVGFLFYNFYPAKIFPGYSATILGFSIGILSILSGVKLATAILVMGVPTADAIFTIIRRVFSKKSPFWHDKGHLHHLLLDLGFGHRSIAVFYWVMSLLFGVFALNLSSKGKLFAIILVVVLVGSTIFSLKFINKRMEEDA